MPNFSFQITIKSSTKMIFNSVIDYIHYSFIFRNKWPSFSEICENLGLISPNTIKQQLKRARLNGDIANIKEDKVSVWKINKPLYLECVSIFKSCFDNSYLTLKVVMKF